MDLDLLIYVVKRSFRAGLTHKLYSISRGSMCSFLGLSSPLFEAVKVGRSVGAHGRADEGACACVGSLACFCVQK